MDLSKLINDNGVYLYQDDNFSTINILLAFLSKNGDKEELINHLLCQYLIRYNKMYSTEKNEMNRKRRELYSLDTYFTTQKIGDTNSIVLYADMISPKVVSDDYSKEVFEYIRNLLLYPDFSDIKGLELIKKTYLSNIAHSLSDPNKLAGKLFNRNTFENNKDKLEYSTDLNYITSVVNSITLKDLEDAYNYMISENSFYRGLVFGNISPSEFKLFREYIPFKTNKENIDYKCESKIISGNTEISDNNIGESIVYVTYKTDKMNGDMLDLLNGLFNNSNGLCHQILREKYDLVYSSYVNIYCYRNALAFKAKINKNNKQKLLDAIDEIISIITDKKKLKPFLDSVKEYLKNEYELLSESKSEMFDEIDDYIRGINTGYEDFMKNIDSFTEEDVIKYTRRFKRMNVFMYKGDKDE